VVELSQQVGQSSSVLLLQWMLLASLSNLRECGSECSEMGAESSTGKPKSFQIFGHGYLCENTTRKCLRTMYSLPFWAPLSRYVTVPQLLRLWFKWVKGESPGQCWKRSRYRGMTSSSKNVPGTTHSTRNLVRGDDSMVVYCTRANPQELSDKHNTWYRN